jgi:hypothetical protein
MLGGPAPFREAKKTDQLVKKALRVRRRRLHPNRKSAFATFSTVSSEPVCRWQTGSDELVSAPVSPPDQIAPLRRENGPVRGRHCRGGKELFFGGNCATIT